MREGDKSILETEDSRPVVPVRLGMTLAEAENLLITATLGSAGGNISKSAAILGIEYLYEIGSLNRPVAKIFSFVESALGVRVCTMPFHEVVDHALQEKWTRDPFDRLIVAHAKAAGASLVTKDERIRKHYRRAIW